MDTEDACLFDRLPFAMRDSFLQQAFKLLDQRHRLKVVPLVCHLWYQLVLSTCTSLEVKHVCGEAAEGLASWLEGHNPSLESLNLEIVDPDELNATSELLDMVCSKVSLQSLKVDYGREIDSNVTLSSLTNLTSLELKNCSFGSITPNSTFLLTQLRQLKLEGCGYLKDAALVALVRGITGSLLHLTTLQLGADLPCDQQQQLLPLTSLGGLEDLRLSHLLGVGSEGVAVLKQLPITSAVVSIRGDEVGVLCSWLQGGGGKINALDLSRKCYKHSLSLPEVELLMCHLHTWAPQLRSLSLSQMDQLCHSTGLVKLTQLTRLKVFDCKLEDAGMIRLSALTSLQELSLEYNEVLGSGGSFNCLASSLRQLTRLDLNEPFSARKAAEAAFGSRFARLRPYIWLINAETGDPSR
jgi:Leucine-rich repeat (LRR) protein